MHEPKPIRSSEITPRQVYTSRRSFLGELGRVGGALTLGAGGALVGPRAVHAASRAAIATYRPMPAPPADAVTPREYATRYNNFYEFGTDKSAPSEYGHELTTDPWSVEISGEVRKPGRYTLEDILKPHDLEERIYRLRCVEAWSMVIPWIGFPLGDLIRRFEPTGAAKYVEFKTLYRPSEFRGQRALFSSLDWPYVEALRLDEAYHPLAILAVGMYGETLPNQNGAPLRLVVPWKYGFKSIKSIVEIRLTRKRPRTSWEISNSREYGFYANVNPAVDHPRWSQKEERRLPSPLFSPNYIETQPFNGYGESVAGLYAGMDLRRNF
jgi:sulfoxide reductase catalytic subunit YedY